MHTGTRQADGTLEKLKTEATYFPASPNSEPDVLPEPFNISALHHIHFTREFCYLGSFLTTHLSNDRDITIRIRKATQKVRGLTNFFLNKAVDLFTNKLIFLAIPVNTVLRGCESWALKAQHINKLQVFFHQLIRRILGINMRRVEHDRIKNENIHIFFGVADIIDSIRSRQFQWLRKLTRQPDSLPTKRLLCAWAPAARQGGAQFITLRTARSTAQLSDSSLVRLYEVRVGLSQRVIESCSITRRLERGGEK
jgi:hypothetical protein